MQIQTENYCNLWQVYQNLFGVTKSNIDKFVLAGALITPGIKNILIVCSAYRSESTFHS